MLLISFFLTTAFLLCSCQSNKQTSNYAGLGFPPNARETFPCWFYQPSPQGLIGSIGISRDISVNHSPEYYAKKNALQGLCRYYNWRGSLENNDMPSGIRKILKGKKDQITIQGNSVSIVDTHRSLGYIYAYAASGKGAIRNGTMAPCPDQNRVSPGKCIPKWLCSPSRKGLGGVVGISFRASSPQRQYDLAFKNALSLLEYTYGIKVQGKDVIEQIKSSGTGSIRIRQSTLGVDKTAGDRERNIRIYVKELRHAKDMLYLWLVSPELPSYESKEGVTWLKNPGNQSFKGGVGSCGLTASGLLSDQIDMAAKRGMKSLVRKYGDSTVNSTQILKGGDCTSYYYNGVTTKYDSKLYPRLRGFYVDENKVAYVWVVFKEKK